tara:strand:+ start:377 stop:577 length:201 start_codon:yes stop_codon:yes gene_type:complete
MEGLMAISRAKNEERYSKKLYGGPGLFCSEIALFMLYVLLEKDLFFVTSFQRSFSQTMEITHYVKF